MATDRGNPFVGPRPLERQDGIFGRDEEIRELLWLFTAERIVWLHSPSGAGKTSLVQAGLVPKLEDDDFAVLPTIRVNREVGGDGNRYEASVLSCLGGTSGLPEFLAVGAGEKSRVLIFDQFEEILTLDSIDVEAKRAFFETVGRALRLPDLWALFVVREDFLPALDPYLGAIPTHMNHRFRLDVLATGNAREAMEQIAKRGGRIFAPEASQLLASELAKVLVTSAGAEEWKPGRVVEPVILQVVCRNMWDEMPPGDTTVEPRHIPAGGKVAQSLANYYANCVKSAADTLRQERAIRTWIGEKLIASGFRNQVLDASGDGAGLGANVVAALVQTHLIRREDRGDRTWYELAHDRLVDPIRADNRRWEEENLHWVQRRADLWRLQDRPKAILLVDDDLAKGERWLRESLPQLTPIESEFLQCSREEQKVRNRIRRRTTLAWICAGLASALFLVATLFYQRDATRQLINLARSEVGQNQLGCAVEDASQAVARATFAGPDLYRSASELVSECLGAHALYEVSGEILGLAFSPASSLLAVAEHGEVTLYRVPAPTFQNRWTLEAQCAGSSQGVTRMSLSPDGARIAFGLSNGAAVSRAIVSAGEIDCGNARGNAVEGLALSNAGDLASAGSDGIWLNDVLISKLDATALTFDPAGKRLAAGLRDGSVRILDQSGKEMARLPYVSGKAVTGVAWGPDSLAAVSRDDGAVRVWDEHGRIKRTESQDDDLGIVAVAASPDGSLIATVGLGLENRTKVWAAGSNAPPLIIESPILEVYVSGVLFLDNSRLLISDSTGKVRLIPLDAKSRNEAAADFLRDHTCRRKQ